jgi:hypothetical protein
MPQDSINFFAPVLKIKYIDFDWEFDGRFESIVAQHYVESGAMEQGKNEHSTTD